MSQRLWEWIWTTRAARGNKSECESLVYGHRIGKRLSLRKREMGMHISNLEQHLPKSRQNSKPTASGAPESFSSQPGRYIDVKSARRRDGHRAWRTILYTHKHRSASDKDQQQWPDNYCAQSCTVLSINVIHFYCYKVPGVNFTITTTKWLFINRMFQAKSWQMNQESVLKNYDRCWHFSVISNKLQLTHHAQPCRATTASVPSGRLARSIITCRISRDTCQNDSR